MGALCCCFNSDSTTSGGKSVKTSKAKKKEYEELEESNNLTLEDSHSHSAFGYKGPDFSPNSTEATEAGQSFPPLTTTDTRPVMDDEHMSDLYRRLTQSKARHRDLEDIGRASVKVQREEGKSQLLGADQKEEDMGVRTATHSVVDSWTESQNGIVLFGVAVDGVGSEIVAKQYEAGAKQLKRDEIREKVRQLRKHKKRERGDDSDDSSE